MNACRCVRPEYKRHNTISIVTCRLPIQIDLLGIGDPRIGKDSESAAIDVVGLRLAEKIFLLDAYRREADEDKTLPTSWARSMNLLVNSNLESRNFEFSTAADPALYE